MGLRSLLLVCISALLAGACSSGQPSAAQAQPAYRPTATIKDIMDSVIDPNADAVWESVATTVDATGIHEKYPQNDEEWKTLRRNTITLLEGSNLLQIPGRLVAKPHEKSENPGIELEPEEMQRLIDQDKESFYKLANALHDTVMVTLKAIEAKDKEALLESGTAIDQACENCHVKYWYPNEAQTQAEQRQPVPPPNSEKK